MAVRIRKVQTTVTSPAFGECGAARAVSHTFSIELLDDVVVIRIVANVDANALIDAMGDIVAATHNYSRRLWDFSAGVHFSNQQIQEIASKGRLWPAPARVAYLASDDLSFGLSRMYQVYSEREQFETLVFRNKQEALNWLRQQK